MDDQDDVILDDAVQHRFIQDTAVYEKNILLLLYINNDQRTAEYSNNVNE